MLKELRPRIGFPWTVRVIAFIVLTTMLFAFSLMRLRLPPTGTKRKLVDLGHLKDLKYLLSCLGFFIGFLGLYVFYYYIQLYAIQVSGTDTNLAFYLLTILNAGSFLGRLLPNYAAGVIGPINTQIIFAALSGILSFCLLVIRTTPAWSPSPPSTASSPVLSCPCRSPSSRASRRTRPSGALAWA